MVGVVLAGLMTMQIHITINHGVFRTSKGLGFIAEKRRLHFLQTPYILLFF